MLVLLSLGVEVKALCLLLGFFNWSQKPQAQRSPQTVGARKLRSSGLHYPLMLISQSTDNFCISLSFPCLSEKLIQKAELMSKGRCLPLQLQQYQSTDVKIPATAAMRSRLTESFQSIFQLKRQQGGQGSDHPACLPGAQKLAHVHAAQYNHATINGAATCHLHLLVSSAEIPRAAGRLCSSLPRKVGTVETEHNATSSQKTRAAQGW